MPSLTHTLLTRVRDSLGLEAGSGASSSPMLSTGGTIPRNSLHMAAQLERVEQLLPAARLGSGEQAEAVKETAAFERSLRKLRGGAPLPGPHTYSAQADALGDALSNLQPGEGSVLASQAGVLAFLRHVDLAGSGIDNLDASFAHLGVACTELNVSRCRIAVLEHMPPALRSLQAYGNRITSIRLDAPHSSLLHAGLGLNSLSSLSVDGPAPSLALALPSLVSLDLSANDLQDLREVLAGLAGLTRLRHLVLRGNPCALTRNARRHTLAALPGLQSLDDERLSPDRQAETSDAFGLLPTAVYEGAHFRLASTSVWGLPTPEDVWAHFGLPPNGPASKGAEAAAPKPGTAPKGATKGGAAAQEPVPAAAAVEAPPPAVYTLQLAFEGFLHHVVISPPPPAAPAPEVGSGNGKPGVAGVPPPAGKSRGSSAASAPAVTVAPEAPPPSSAPLPSEATVSVPATLQLRDALRCGSLRMSLSVSGEGEAPPTLLGSGTLSLAPLLHVQGASSVGGLKEEEGGGVELELVALPPSAARALARVKAEAEGLADGDWSEAREARDVAAICAKARVRAGVELRR
jgi:hypothetical protein